MNLQRGSVRVGLNASRSCSFSLFVFSTQLELNSPGRLVCSIWNLHYLRRTFITIVEFQEIKSSMTFIVKQSILLVFKPGKVSSEDISGSGLMHKILRVCLEELARTNQWIHLELTGYKSSIHNESEGAWAPSVSMKSVSFKQYNDAPMGIHSVPSMRAKFSHNVAVQKRSHEYHLGKTTPRNSWLYLLEKPRFRSWET